MLRRPLLSFAPRNFVSPFLTLPLHLLIACYILCEILLRPPASNGLSSPRLHVTLPNPPPAATLKHGVSADAVACLCGVLACQPAGPGPDCPAELCAQRRAAAAGWAHPPGKSRRLLPGSCSCPVLRVQ